MSRGGVDVAVVGAGVTGAALALALAQDGRRVAVIEAREPAPWRAGDAPDLRVYALASASIDLLDTLGAWPRIARARVAPYVRMEVWDAAGGSPLRFDAADAGAGTLGAIVEHALLQRVLWDQLASHGNLTLHCPASVAAIERTDAGVVLALDDGKRVRAALAVAADGAASTLRTLAGIDVARHDYGQRGLVAYVDVEHDHRDTAWQRFLPGGPLAFLPAGPRRCSIVWSLADDEAQRLLAVDDDAFCRELEHAFDRRLGRVTSVSPRAAFPLRRQLAARYVDGRVVLVGDAAHVVHPLAGQGLNLGLADVAALRDASSSVSLDDDTALSRALRRYERARRSDNALAAYAFDGLERLFGSDALLPTLLRGPALGLVDALTPLKRFFASHASGIRR